MKALLLVVSSGLFMIGCTPQQTQAIVQGLGNASYRSIDGTTVLATTLATVVRLATDNYTQSVDRQSKAWQQIGAKPENPSTVQVQENGQTVNKIQEQKLVLTESQILNKKKRLSSAVKDQLLASKQDSIRNGGGLKVICPVNAPTQVISDFREAGIKYEQHSDQLTDYIIIMSRNS